MAGTVDIGPARAAKATMILVKVGKKIVAKTPQQVPKLWKAMKEQMTKPKTTTTVGKSSTLKELQETASGVPNSTGPLSFLGKVKRIILTAGQIEF